MSKFLEFSAGGARPHENALNQHKSHTNTPAVCDFSHQWIFNHLVLLFRPHLTSIDHGQLRDYFDNQIQCEFESLWIDLTNARWITLENLRPLTVLAKDAVRHQSPVVFITADESVQNLLKLTGVTKYAHIATSRAEAVGAVYRLTEGASMPVSANPETFCRRVARARESWQPTG